MEREQRLFTFWVHDKESSMYQELQARLRAEAGMAGNSTLVLCSPLASEVEYSDAHHFIHKRSERATGKSQSAEATSGHRTWPRAGRGTVLWVTLLLGQKHFSQEVHGTSLQWGKA